jgi:hypothetical protein
MYANLQYIYVNIIVECILRNPLYRYQPDTVYNCPLFEKKLEEYIASV